MHSWTDPATIISILAALASLLAAWHAIQANSKGTTINANVNSRLEELLSILSKASITIPHDVAAKVVYAPPPQIPPDATVEERLAAEWFAKIKSPSGHNNNG